MNKLILILSVSFLVACSSGPSDGDVGSIVKQGMSQLDASLAPVGIQMSDLIDIESKIISKADKGGGQWLVQVEQSVVFKKSLEEFSLLQQATLSRIYGNFKKGQKTPPQTSQFTMIKGDKGWIASN